MNDLRRRLFVSLILIAIVGFLLFFALNPIFQYLLAILISLLAAVAVWEYVQLVVAKGGRIVSQALTITTGAIVFSFFLSAKELAIGGVTLIVFLLGFVILFALHFGKKEGAIMDLAVSSFGLLYIAVPMGMLLGILYLPGVEGRWWVAYLLVVTKITDIGAYFAGNLWGKRKLAPQISPKKTIVGAIFGLFCAIVASVVFYLVSGDTLSIASSGKWIVLGLILGIMAQFGDLSESLLKRDANKKDSNALPGLGGILDSIDSMLFNTVILYIYLNFLKV